PKTGLNRHAYDENRNMFWADKTTGLSQHCWGRAQGWYTMALIEVLDAVPEDYSRRGELIELLRKDLDAVLKWQDKKSGVWYQVMDSPNREGNYLESTCSAMFTYALLKAYRKGYLGSKYRDAGIKAYRGIINNFIRINDDQTISLTNCCSVAGLGPGISPEVEAALKSINPKSKAKENKRRDGSYEYYLSEQIRDNDAKGIGPFIWASLEMEQMDFTTENVMQPINRQAVTSRNNPVVTEADPLTSLSVGNGHFTTTVDITGLQSYPFDYEAGVPLTAMSDWGWHKFENTNNLLPSESEKAFNLGHGHSEIYAVEYKKAEDGRHKQATEYFRVNPHRLNLGIIGLNLKDAQGQAIPLDALTAIHQELKLYDGVIESTFQADGQQVDVTTAALQDKDAILYRIKSPLLADGRASILIRMPYPTGKHADDATDLTKPTLHKSRLIINDMHSAVIEHTIDSTRYYLKLNWSGKADFTRCGDHDFSLTTTASDVLAFKAEYTQEKPFKTDAYENYIPEPTIVFDQELRSVLKAWNRWWQQGAIVDFSQCTDPRAKELERRVVLSQYLTQINCANATPPQETGLTYNSWFGRPHLEMTWWHMVDFALWSRPETVAKVLDWYNKVAYPEAKKIA
ncbi:MAG: glycoside hydrolase family 88 protein, partial [Prevotella sp.]|nr:glycoside hydrolase family 88 protein [Prevotella sp.]